MGRRVAEGTPTERTAAIDELMLCNQKYVLMRARRYLPRACGDGLSLEDLVQEGNLGLHRAAEKFDYKRGFRFTTYATAWINQSITRAIEVKDRTIRVPVYLHTAWFQLQSMRKRLNRAPTLEEAVEAGIRPAAYRGLATWMQPIRNLDAPLGDDGSQRLLDIVPDDAEGAEAALATAVVSRLVTTAVATLRGQERDVITLRFGLADGCPLTLEAVGQRLGVSRERVRQVQNRALRTLHAEHPQLAAAWAP